MQKLLKEAIPFSCLIGGPGSVGTAFPPLLKMNKNLLALGVEGFYVGKLFQPQRW